MTAIDGRSLTSQEAEKMLLRLAGYESLALACDENTKPSLVLSDGEVQRWREMNSGLYRKLVGVDPSKRHSFQSELEGVAGMSMMDAISSDLQMANRDG